MKTCIIDIECTTLDPTEGRIICIGTLDADTGETRVFYNNDEKKIVQDFLSYYAIQKFNRLVGFNLMFDVRYIFARCLKYSIPAKEFTYSIIDDVMMILKSAGRKIYNFNKPHPLDDWAKFLFNDGKMMKSENVPILYEEGKIGEIIEYNKKDLILTFGLWKRIKLVLEKNITKGYGLEASPLGRCDCNDNTIYT